LEPHPDQAVAGRVAAEERQAEGGASQCTGDSLRAMGGYLPFFATLQTELLDRRSWPTRRMLSSATFDYIEGFYNRRRRHSALGYLSPDTFEKRGDTVAVS